MSVFRAMLSAEGPAADGAGACRTSSSRPRYAPAMAGRAGTQHAAATSSRLSHAMTTLHSRRDMIARPLHMMGSLLRLLDQHR